jgi:hypothetical protein
VKGRLGSLTVFAATGSFLCSALPLRTAGWCARTPRAPCSVSGLAADSGIASDRLTAVARGRTCCRTC